MTKRRTSLKMYSDKELRAELRKRSVELPESDRVQSDRQVGVSSTSTPEPYSPGTRVNALLQEYKVCSCGYPNDNPCKFNAPDCVVYPPGSIRPVRLEVKATGPIVTDEDLANYDVEE